jgi:Ca-activated chloride channel family protein
MSASSPHFAEPVWLWFALLGPAAVAALHRYSARIRRRQLERIAAPEFAAALTRSHSTVRRGLKELLLAIAAGGIGLALARPQWGEPPQDGRQPARADVVFALDCSRSMMASDVTPSRLERARLAILDFVEHRGVERVGLVAFAGQAFLQCPLTPDHDAFRDALMAVGDGTIPVAGTDIGRAMDEAFRAMDKESNPKLLILVTDGEDLENRGVRTAERLAAKGVVAYTIGVGTPAGAEIRTLDEQGQPTLLRDSNGNVVRSKLDEPTLRAIAKGTHGEYHALGPLGEGLIRAGLDFETHGAAANVSGVSKNGVDRFHFFVAAALLLLVVESLTGTRRKT